MGNSDTTIPCSEATRDRLRDLKRGGEPYDATLRRVLDAYESDEVVPDRTRGASDE